MPFTCFIAVRRREARSGCAISMRRCSCSRAARACAIVMDVNGWVMQRALDCTRQLGQVVCDESHVYVCESGGEKVTESGRVWQLKLW